MFLIQLTNLILFGFVPEPVAVLFLGFSMISTAVAGRRILKQQAKVRDHKRMQDFTQG